MVYIPPFLPDMRDINYGDINCNNINYGDITAIETNYVDDEEVIKILQRYSGANELDINEWPLRSDIDVVFPNIKTLSIGIAKLDCLRFFPELRILKLGFTRDHELNNLSHVPHLIEFHCAGGLTHTDYFRHCPRLMSINVGQSMLNRLDLSSCPNLLNFSNKFGKYKDFSGLSMCRNLRVLCCTHADIVSLNGIQNMELKVLNIAECRQIQDIDALRDGPINNAMHLMSFHFTKPQHNINLFEGYERFYIEDYNE